MRLRVALSPRSFPRLFPRLFSCPFSCPSASPPPAPKNQVSLRRQTPTTSVKLGRHGGSRKPLANVHPIAYHATQSLPGETPSLGTFKPSVLGSILSRVNISFSVVALSPEFKQMRAAIRPGTSRLKNREAFVSESDGPLLVAVWYLSLV